jgi:PKD repeat protein
VDNFGWPCYEGVGRQPGYDGANLNICENLYAAGTAAVKAPYYTYDHAAQVVANESCATGNSSVAGMAFYEGGSYPDRFDGALFFADYSRKCIWAMEKGTNGLPAPAKRSTFVAGAAGPVDLEIGPGGDLFYSDFDSGTIRRIQYFVANEPPVARATASPNSGPVPLTVAFDGNTSSDADGDALSYAWDLDGDGAYDDSTLATPSRTYSAGSYQVDLRVTDSGGLSDTLDEPLRISAGNTKPTATINTPPSTTAWKVGDRISFSGSATDQQDGTLSASRLSWSLILHHCDLANSCHEHPVQDFSSVAQGSFVAPDHEYPSHLELRLTATDSGGLTDTKSVRLDPQTVALTFNTNPGGLQLAMNSSVARASFSRTVIVGSKNTISAITPQNKGKTTYTFRSWSDGGAQTHVITAPDSATTYQAFYNKR